MLSLQEGEGRVLLFVKQQALDVHGDVQRYQTMNDAPMQVEQLITHDPKRLNRNQNTMIAL